MKYPAVYLMEPGAHGEVLSIAFAGKGQHQDAGGKDHPRRAEHDQPDHQQVDQQGRRTGQLSRSAQDRTKARTARRATWSATRCCWTGQPLRHLPVHRDRRQDVTIGHEASVSKIGEDQLFYLMSRGIGEDEANAMIVNGFIEPIAKELPAEYSIELYRLVQLQMEGSVG